MMIRNFLYQNILRPFLKWGMGLQVENQEVLNGFKQAVLVANHNSHMDTMGLLSTLDKHWLKQLRPVAARDYFARNRLQEWCSTAFLNLLLVTRRKEDRKPGENPIQDMLQVIDRGESLLIFPEGTRGKPNELGEFKCGVGKILEARPDIPVIPVYIENTGMILPGGSLIPLPFQFKIRFGSPRFVSNSNVPEIMNDLRGTIKAMKPQEKNQQNPFAELPQHTVLC